MYSCNPKEKKWFVSMNRAGWLAFVLLIGFQAQAATVLTTGDVWLGNGSSNQGGDGTLKVNPSFGVLTSLIQFDLSAFAGQTVTGPGTFTVFGNGGPGVFGGGSIALHTMLHSWSEGLATFGNLGPTPGAQAGEDFDPLILSTSGGVIGCCNLPVTFTVDASVIQAWIDSPGNNFGFILEPNTATSAGIDFLSREGGAPPTLTFNAITPPTNAPEPVTAWLAICGPGLIALHRLRRRS
jgi:hypothetical protein